MIHLSLHFDEVQIYGRQKCWRDSMYNTNKLFVLLILFDIRTKLCIENYKLGNVKSIYSIQ